MSNYEEPDWWNQVEELNDQIERNQAFERDLSNIRQRVYGEFPQARGGLVECNFASRARELASASSRSAERSNSFYYEYSYLHWRNSRSTWSSSECSSSSSPSISSCMGFQIHKHEIQKEGQKLLDKFLKSNSWAVRNSLFFKMGTRFVCKSNEPAFVELFHTKYLVGYYLENTDTLMWVRHYVYSNKSFQVINSWVPYNQTHEEKDSRLPVILNWLVSQEFMKDLQEELDQGNEVLHPSFYKWARLNTEPKEPERKVRFIRI